MKKTFLLIAIGLFSISSFASELSTVFNCDAKVTYDTQEYDGTFKYAIYTIGNSPKLIGQYTNLADGKVYYAASVDSQEVPLSELVSDDEGIGQLLIKDVLSLSIDQIKRVTAYVLKFDQGNDGNMGAFVKVVTTDGEELAAGMIGWGAIATCQ